VRTGVNLCAGIDRLVPAGLERQICAHPTAVGLMEHRSVESQPWPSRRCVLRGHHLGAHSRLSTRRFHCGEFGVVAVIDDPVRIEQGSSGTRLQEMPPGQRFLCQRHVGRVGVPESEDAFRPVRRAAIVTPGEAVEEQHGPAPASQCPCGGGPGHSRTDHDDIRHHDSLQCRTGAVQRTSSVRAHLELRAIGSYSA
jgi:hypothetical protein